MPRQPFSYLVPGLPIPLDLCQSRLAKINSQVITTLFSFFSFLKLIEILIDYDLFSLGDLHNYQDKDYGLGILEGVTDITREKLCLPFGDLMWFVFISQFKTAYLLKPIFLFFRMTFSSDIMTKGHAGINLATQERQ